MTSRDGAPIVTQAPVQGIHTLLHIAHRRSPNTVTDWTDIVTLPDWFNLRLALPAEYPYDWAVLYTATGNHDLVHVFEAMRAEPHRLRQIWSDFLDGIDFGEDIP